MICKLAIGVSKQFALSLCFNPSKYKNINKKATSLNDRPRHHDDRFQRVGESRPGCPNHALPVSGGVVAAQVTAVEVGLEAGVVPPGARVLLGAVLERAAVVVPVRRRELHAVVDGEAVTWERKDGGNRQR